MNTNPAESAARPLDGITVIALEQAIAAPFCTRQLADLGARVIKIERPGVGDFARNYDDRVEGLSSYFVWSNRCKESVTLDLKNALARDVLEALLDRADVLVQNLAPGASRRLGLDHASLEQRYPRLVVCDISGYGEGGPHGDRKAYDLLIQAESGFVSVTGTPDSVAKAPAPIADVAAASYALSNILAALLQRSSTGKGCRIDISMLECMLEWNSYPLYYSYGDKEAPPRRGADHATIYPYGIFAVGDGHSVMLGLQNEREWRSFCEVVLDNPDLAADPRFDNNAARSLHREELREIVESVFADRAIDDVLALLEDARIASARVNEMRDVWRHEQLRARDRWVEVDSPAGALRALLPPGLPSGFPPKMGGIPALGEHTLAVLDELGFDDAAVARLRAASAI